MFTTSRYLHATLFSLTLIAACAIAGCGGGGGGGGGAAPAGGGGNPPPTLPPVTQQSSQISVSSGGGNAALPPVGGYSGTVALPALTSGTPSTVTATTSTVVPSGIPALQSMFRQPKDTKTVYFYESFVSPVALTFATWPGFSVTMPSSVSTTGQNFYVSVYTTSGWLLLEGPGSVSGQTVSFAAVPGPATIAANATYYFAFYSTGNAGAAPIALDNTSVSLVGAGQAATVHASEIGFSGAFSASSTNCANVASIAPAPGAGAFTVTAIAAGTCAFSISGASGVAPAQLNVTVTTTQIGGQ